MLNNKRVGVICKTAHCTAKVGAYYYENVQIRADWESPVLEV